VLVDNRFDFERSPLHLDYCDWYHYGGTTPGAAVRRLGARWIEIMNVETRDFQSRKIEEPGRDLPRRLGYRAL
jgi:hypothetical protein